MSNVEKEFPFIISDACDEAGKGQFEIRVNQQQLDLLLEYDFIYEDTTSDYVEPSGRRHFHPNHDCFTTWEVLETVMLWPGSGCQSIANVMYERYTLPVSPD